MNINNLKYSLYMSHADRSTNISTEITLHTQIEIITNHNEETLHNHLIIYVTWYVYMIYILL